MKFGPVPLGEAEGAILAHSLPLPGGRLRKGLTLTAEHLADLADAGLREVVVARLEPGDVHENDAALRLAQAAAEGAAHLRLGAPFTGRVNLLAERAGLALLDAEKITAANAVDPSLSVATVPVYQQVAEDGMIATIKLVAFAVSGKIIEAAAAHLHGAIRLAVPIHQSASLIVTDLPGGLGTKGQEAISARVAALGMTLCETLTCRHETAALAETLAAAQGDILLILTASATSDSHDTAPTALRQVGGTLTRFGIPVDPGNLLFLGALRQKPVIGLPNSARSPVLHGADWVLGRVACELEISPHDFAAMGVGGLLKEIPTRPQPRRGPRR